MNHIIKELIQNGIPVKGEYNLETETPVFIVSGFYKSGEIKLVEENNKLIAKARYDEETEIEELYNIVALNYLWWQRSKDRFDGWKNPDFNWIPLLEKFNFITKKIETIINYV